MNNTSILRDLKSYICILTCLFLATCNISPLTQVESPDFIVPFLAVGNVSPHVQGDPTEEEENLPSVGLPLGYVHLSGKGNVNASGSGTGAQFWVDVNNTNASDLGPGSEAQPWKTFKHAVQTAKAGDTVNVMPGIYEDTESQAHITGMWRSFSPSNNGEPGNPITYRSVVPRAAILKSSAPNTNEVTRDKALAFYTRHDIIFDGFKTVGMVHFVSSQRINFINGEVTMGSIAWADPSLLWGISLERSHNCILRNNRIHSMAPAYKDGVQFKVHNQAGISIFGGRPANSAVNNLVEYNELDMSNNVYSGLGNKAGNLNGNVWRNNFVKNAVSAVYSVGSTDLVTSVYNSVYKNNILAGNKYGVEFEYKTRDAILANNTIVNSSSAGFKLTALNSTNITFVNNVISNTQKMISAEGYFGSEVGYFLDLFSYGDYNQYYQNSSSFAEKSASPKDILATFEDYQSKGLDAHGINGDPDFINSSGQDPEDFKRKNYPQDGAGVSYSSVRGAYTSDLGIVGNY